MSRRLPVFALAAIAIALATPASAGTQVPRWNAGQIDLFPAQPAGHDGAGVIVAVLDTWIDATHPDFGGRVLPGADCVGGTCTPGGTTTPDGCEAHGTHVAGIVASASYGVAPDATILPARVLSGSTPSDCVANSSDVANAVRWAAAHGARIINISLGTAYPVHGEISDLASAVDQVSAAGVLVVAAAGNQQAPVGTSYGTAAVVVAATGPDGQLAGYSQRGAGVSFAAPGGDPGSGPCTVSNCVVSTWADNQYAALAGTSMAAPHVAGLAALLWAQNPHLARSVLLQRMESTARPLGGAGYGLIDAAAALGVAPSSGGSKSPAAGGVSGGSRTGGATGPAASVGAGVGGTAAGSGAHTSGALSAHPGSNRPGAGAGGSTRRQPSGALAGAGAGRGARAGGVAAGGGEAVGLRAAGSGGAAGLGLTSAVAALLVALDAAAVLARIRQQRHLPQHR
ncbi:MAG: S8 family peptidase [Mycobacteriales bacterium]